MSKHLGIDGRTLCGAPFSKMTSTPLRARVSCAGCRAVIAEMRSGRVRTLPTMKQWREDWLTAKQVGAELGIDRTNIGRAWDSGKMPYAWRGNRRGMTREMLREWSDGDHRGIACQLLTGLIYALQWEGRPDAPVKIGFTSQETVDSRVTGVQTGSPYRLIVLRTTPGTYRDELALHHRFAASRLEGEWFRASPEVMQWATELTSTAQVG